MKNHYRMFTLVTVKQEDDEGEHRGPMRIIASDSSVDRMGDIVRQSWRLENFKRNPVLLWSHDASIPPVGIAKDVRVETIDGQPALTFEPKWDTGPHNPLANTVAEQFRNGTLSAVSVGFRPGAVTPRSALDEHNEDFANTGLILDENELLEISPVTIPANANALAIRAVTDPADELIEKAKAEAEAIVKAALAEVPELVADLVKAALPAEVLAALGTPDVRKAIKATVDGHLDARPSGEMTTAEYLRSLKPEPKPAKRQTTADYFSQAAKG